MKKVISLILVLIMILSLSACGGTSSGATIIDNEGNTIQMTADELMEANGNEVYFDKMYAGAEIVVEGTVEKVDFGFYSNGSPILFDRVELEEGWEVYLPHDAYDLAELAVGTKVRIASNVYRTFVNVELLGCFYDEDQLVYTDSSLRTTELTVIK